jgi:hypothetical protein
MSHQCNINDFQHWAIQCYLHLSSVGSSGFIGCCWSVQNILCTCTPFKTIITKGYKSKVDAQRTDKTHTHTHIYIYIHTRAVWEVCSHFEYLENWLCGLDVIWQPVRGDLTVHP